MSWGARAAPVLLAAGLCALHFASFDVVSQPIVTDVRYFLYYAWRVAEGAVPHLDFFENKPQLSTFAGALLYRLGEGAGLEPLLAIRSGYLALAGAGGLLAFAVFRRLGGGSGAAGLLGALAYCSFGLLGALPAVGNVPKLLMAISVPAMALCAHDRRWLWAGLLGGLASIDWQVGALVWLGAAVAAALHGRPRRAALLRVTLGGVLGVAPFLLYYASRGALAAVYRQELLATLARGSSAAGAGGVGGRVARIAALADRACPQQQWLFVLGLLGLLVLASWLWRGRGGERARLLAPLAVSHGGVLAFSLVDFQAYGDFFLLLHAVAFGLGCAWLALFEAARRIGELRFPGGRARGLGVALALGLACLAARPGPLRPALELASDDAEPGAVLADQREVAAALAARTGGRTLVMLDASELLFLMRRANALPNVYWNRAARSAFARPEDASPADTLRRLLASADPDAFVLPSRVRGAALPGFAPHALAARSGRYRIELFEREAP